MYVRRKRIYSLIVFGLVTALAVGCGGEGASADKANNSSTSNNDNHDASDDATGGADSGDQDTGGNDAAGKDTGGNDAGGNDTGDAGEDNTAPSVVEASPAQGAEGVASDAPVTITFSEALDPQSVDTTSVAIEFDGGQASSHTVELSADGLVATIEYDRSLIAAPYEATITVDGVTDLAGNALADSWSYRAPSWLAESLPGAFIDLHYVAMGGSEYVVGMTDDTYDHLTVLERGSTGWTEVASRSLGQIYDLDVVDVHGKIYIAVLGGSHVFLSDKILRLHTFDPADGTLSAGGYLAVGPDSSHGAVAIDMRALPNQTQTAAAIATVSDGELKVFRFLDDELTAQTPNSFTASYDYVRDESLSVHVHSDTQPEVIFARCQTDSDPCVRTIVEQVRLTNSGWQEYPGLLQTPLSPGISNACDEFINFEARYAQDTAQVLFAYEAPCNALAPTIRAVKATPTGWDYIAGTNLLDTIPSPDTLAYTAHLALGASNQVHALAASSDRLMVASYGPSNATWMEQVASDLNTWTYKLMEPVMFMTPANRPIVLFRQTTTTHLYRAN